LTRAQLALSGYFKLLSVLDIVWKDFGIGWRANAKKMQFNSFATKLGAEVNDLKSSVAFQRYTS